MGGPGSGKGVLAKNLPKITHFSIGEALRNIIQNAQHPLSESFKVCIEQGKLLNDDDIFNILSTASELRKESPVLLDGFPRTPSQWNKFKQSYGLPKAVIDISVSEETMRRHLSNRGRKDDKENVIEYRINDYINNTQIMAQQILQEVVNSLVIKADSLTPEEVSEISKEFLENENLYPKENWICFQRKS
jgi:adenylate kinase family enzyme